MSSVELWCCDWHANPPEGDSDYVLDDEARDKEWVRMERSVTREYAGMKPFSVLEIAHVCPDCLKDPDCHEWIRAEGYKGYFDEDVQRLAAIV